MFRTSAGPPVSRALSCHRGSEGSSATILKLANSRRLPLGELKNAVSQCGAEPADCAFKGRELVLKRREGRRPLIWRERLYEFGDPGVPVRPLSAHQAGNDLAVEFDVVAARGQ